MNDEICKATECAASSAAPILPMRNAAPANSPASAISGPGVGLKRCNSGWCRVTGQGFDGYVSQDRLWGVYPGEKVD